MEAYKFRVYGTEGHRQKESFNKSFKLDFGVEQIEVRNADLTGTNDYTELVMSGYEQIEDAFDVVWAQISDGIFENKRVGWVEYVSEVSA